MFKFLLGAIVILNCAPVLANSVVFNQQQFLEEVKAEIGESYRDAEISIGGINGCDVVISESAGPIGNRVTVSIASEGRDLVYLIVDPNDQVQMTKTESSDGSYSKVYHFEFGSTLTSTHADDAYDEVEIDSGAGRMSCGIYY